MRHTLDSPLRRTLFGLSAVCARKRLGSSITSIATSTYATRPQIRPKPQTPAHITLRRRLSTSSTSPPHPLNEEESSTSKPATHAPLPYYKLFPNTLSAGPPPAGPFTLDTRSLHREFLQLQAASHPDFHHDGGSGGGASLARRQAEAVSSHINAAYTTLASPLLRAQYLLAARYGHDLAGDEASELSGPADPELLMAVLEARESIEEARTEDDLEGVKAENEVRIAAALESLERAFAEEDVPAAVRETVKLRYWANIRESVDNWEEGKPVVLQH